MKNTADAREGSTGRSRIDMRAQSAWPSVFLLLIVSWSLIAVAQEPIAKTRPAYASADPAVEQTARLLNLDSELTRLASLQAQRATGAAPTMEEVTVRQQILESVQVCALQVDGVIAEIANEQSEISSLRTVLQNRRDRKVNRLTTSALLVGSGLGAGASATQFTSFSSTTQNVGDAVAVGSSVATIILSVLASRAQNGPLGRIESTPNMLAPLLGGTAVLRTYYPPVVMRYLQSVPPGEDPGRGTRMEQLIGEWNDAGRLSTTASAERTREISALTASGNSDAKVSIGDLTARLAMLGDVRGRVSLIKRDLATLVFYVHETSRYRIR